MEYWYYEARYWQAAYYGMLSYANYLSGQVNVYRDRVNSLNSQLSTAQSQLSGANAQIATLQTQLSSAQAQLSSAQAQLSSTQSELDITLANGQDAAVNLAEAEASGAQVLSDLEKNLIDNAAQLVARNDSMSTDLNKSISDWGAELGTINTKIDGVDVQLADINNSLGGELATAERNDLLEQQANLSLQNQFDKDRSQSIGFTIASLTRQRDTAQAAADAFKLSVQGTGEEVPFINASDLNNYAIQLGQTITDIANTRNQLRLDLDDTTGELEGEKALRLQRENELAEETTLRLQGENELNLLNIEHIELTEQFNAGEISIQELENKNLELEQKKKELEGTVTYEKVMGQIDKDDAAMRELIDEGDISSIDFEKLSIPEMPDATEPADLSEAVSPGLNQSIGYAMGVQSEQQRQPQLPQAPSDERIVPEVPMPDAPIHGTLVKASAVSDALRKKNEAETGIGSFLA